MLIDTHCHMNIMVKKTFDTLMSAQEIENAHRIIDEAHAHDVSLIINVGTNVPESINCTELARTYNSVFAAVGIHPTDCSSEWRTDFKEIVSLVTHKERNKIVAIGETGIDCYHQPYDLARQQDAFRAHIELALTHDLALIIHSREASQETLAVLDEYRNDLSRGVFHCFSYDADIAQEVIGLSFVLGIGGTITYPKNNVLRSIVETTAVENIVLETDAPFLPPQTMRGKQNHPQEIQTIAHYIATLRKKTYEEIATETTNNARKLFQLP